LLSSKFCFKFENIMANTKKNRKEERGFASMDPERVREIAREGGIAAHKSGNAHEFTSDEARQAGRKGGSNSHGGGRKKNRGQDNA
jgi:uncharacterized protein